jgi:hypothetical protein
MNEKPEFKETLCPICSKPCVALSTEYNMLSWCEIGHICLSDETNRVKTLYSFGENEEIERINKSIYKRGDEKMIITTEVPSMVNIDTEDVSFNFIKGMYIKGNGSGIQVSPRTKEKEKEIEDVCLIIAREICRLQDILEY